MKILISGASGLVGTELKHFLSTQGHEVFALTRSKSASDADIQWNPDMGHIDIAKLEGFDAVIHLAGENIAAKRWSAKQKELIRSSRVKGTKLLSESLAKLQNPPKALVSASAIGFYGDRPGEELDENSDSQASFLSDVCIDWENATQAARNADIRVVNARTGVVLSPKGGALALMLPIFMLGGGGNLGSGRQYMSWISIDDLVSGLYYCVMDDKLSGPVNMVAPEPVSNKEFTKTLGRVIKRPTLFPVPQIAARILLGEMADALLFADTKVHPSKLEQSGYKFLYPNLEAALKHMLGKN